MAENRSLLREVDDQARALARRLIRTARFGAIAVLEPGSGAPFASRVAVATDVDGTPLMLMSALSTHTAALQADARCSLLLGEPGKGDPLAHPRITLLGRAERVGRDDAALERVRRRYLARHHKAQLYVDFGDFGFFRLIAERASLNGGFGRAFALRAADFLCAGPASEALATIEADAIAHMNADHADAVALIAAALAAGTDGRWELVSLDAHGVDLACGEALERVEYDTPLTDGDGLRAALVALTRRARERAGD